jgi:hypothetical protein
MGRLIVLGAAFGLMLWWALGKSPDDPGSYQARSGSVASSSNDTGEHDPWTREERAGWRDSVDQRLRR